MFISKRGNNNVLTQYPDGRRERIHPAKLVARLSKLSYGLSQQYVDTAAIATKAIARAHIGVTALQLDYFAAEAAIDLSAVHPDYDTLAARIAVSCLHKHTKKRFSTVVSHLYHHRHESRGQVGSAVIPKKTFDAIQQHRDELDSAIVHERDSHYTYSGVQAMQRCLLRIGDDIAERPQHMMMRLAMDIHQDDVKAAIESYTCMSKKCFTHSAALSTAGVTSSRYASCVLINMKEDSLDGIYDTLSACATALKSADDVNLNVQCIRAAGSYIDGTNGTSTGIIPMLRVFNNTVRHVGQGDKRHPPLVGFTVYLEPWHADVLSFLDLSKGHGNEELRARDMSYGLCVPDLFMKRVEADDMWTLMCPHECPGLTELYGNEFEALYEEYERSDRGRKTIRAQKLWHTILQTQLETTRPCVMYKDACNRKSNHNHLGTIRLSNFHSSVMEYSLSDEITTCISASLVLPTYVKTDRTFDFQKLYGSTCVAVKDLDRIIGRNSHEVPGMVKNSSGLRALGLGAQGLADALHALQLPFDSPEAKQLNIHIFETLYYASLAASCNLAKRHGPHDNYADSPISQGRFQFDLWNTTPTGLWDWATLKQDIAKYGVRNSLVIAPSPMPPAVSNIVGVNPLLEPYISNLHSCQTRAGEAKVWINSSLCRDLATRGLWTDNIRKDIITSNGSVQEIDGIPNDVKAIYKTAWEISQKHLLYMAADRAPFIDQSQPINMYMREANMDKMTSMHFVGWRLGLKSGLCSFHTSVIGKTSSTQHTHVALPVRTTHTRVTNTSEG